MPSRISPILISGLKGCRNYLLAITGFSLALNILTLALPLYTIQLYNRVLVSGSGATLTVITLAVVVALLVSSLLDDIRSRILIAIGCRFDARLSADLLERQVEDSAASGGMLSSQALRDLDLIRSVVTSSGTLALLELPWTPIFVFVCWLLHPLLGLVSGIGALIMIILAVVNQWTVARPLKDSTREANAAYRLTDTILRNAEVVQSMGMLPDILRHWRHHRIGLIERQALASTRHSAIASLSKLFRYLLQIAIFAVGAWLVINHDMSVGAMFASSLITARALQPIDQFVGVWRQIANGWEALKRVEGAMASPVRDSAMKLPAPAGRLSIENLSYVLRGVKTPVLANVSFTVEPGESLGIVGPSAAGKSTLARLITGAFRPTGGIVRLDGADTYTWNREEFGRAVGYVPQDIELFDGTIKDNIARFRKASPEDIVRAAQLAGVHEMILKLPNGYETVIGATGNGLSGGQRQRLALARAVFGDPRVVIFDEPNSNLDAEGEATLRTLVERLQDQGVTIVMIAHRPSVLANLDKVLVLANGAVVNYGNVSDVMPQIAPGFQVVRRNREQTA